MVPIMITETIKSLNEWMCLTLKRIYFMWIVLGLFIFIGVYLIWDSYINPDSTALTWLSACSTYAVVLVTLVYAITTSEQRDLMASQLNEMHSQRQLMADQLEEIRRDDKIQRLNKEMDFVVGPLRSKIGSYKIYEPLFIQEDDKQRSIAFWEDIKRNLYLASSDLRVNVEKYLAVFEEQKNQLRTARYTVQEKANNYDKEKGRGFTETGRGRYLDLHKPAPINEGYNSYLKSIEDGNKQIDSNSNYGKTRSLILEIANEGHNYDIHVDDQKYNVSIKEVRRDLEQAIQVRYDAIKHELDRLETSGSKVPTVGGLRDGNKKIDDCKVDGQKKN